MVVLKKAGVTLTWDGQQWAGDRAMATLLNAAHSEVRGYWPNEKNAREMLIAVFGSDECEIVRSDPQPPEPGIVY